MSTAPGVGTSANVKSPPGVWGLKLTSVLGLQHMLLAGLQCWLTVKPEKKEKNIFDIKHAVKKSSLHP